MTARLPCILFFIIWKIGFLWRILSVMNEDHGDTRVNDGEEEEEEEEEDRVPNI